MIQMVTRRNSQGYLASHVLQRLLPDTEVSVIFDDDFNISQENSVYDSEADMVILLGIPYKNNQATVATELLGDKLNPFSQILHICSFGDTMDIPFVHSIVDEVASPSKVLLNYLIEGQKDNFISKIAPIQDKPQITEWVDLGDDYHRYELARTPTIDPVVINDFITFNGEWFSLVAGDSNPTDTLEAHRDVFRALEANRKEYMARRLKTADIRMAGAYLVAVVYAEEYPNEIAHWIMEQYGANGFEKIVVLVGVKTKGDDMFRVRTRGTHAGDIAKFLNNGSGKEQVGTVFLGDPSKHIMDVVVNMLSTKP